MSYSGKNIPGNVVVIDLPVVEGATSVSYTTEKALAGLLYVGIQAKGAEAITPTIAGVTGATVAVEDGYGFSDATATNGVANAVAGVGQANATAVGYENLAPLGTAQGTGTAAVEDKTYVAPNSTVAPLGATTIAQGATVVVAIDGDVVVWEDLPAADGNGDIVLPTAASNSQAGWTNLPDDSIPFKVKATDTQADTFAGVVRLIFAKPVTAPSSPTGNTVTNGLNPVQAGSNAGTGAGVYTVTDNTYTTVTGETGHYKTYA